MQIFFHFFLILCTFFLFTIFKVCAHVRVCSFSGFESSNLPKNEKPPKREVIYFVAKLGFVVRLVLVAMTVALQHLATAHPHSPLPSRAWWGPL